MTGVVLAGISGAGKTTVHRAVTASLAAAGCQTLVSVPQAMTTTAHLYLADCPARQADEVVGWLREMITFADQLTARARAGGLTAHREAPHWTPLFILEGFLYDIPLHDLMISRDRVALLEQGLAGLGFTLVLLTVPPGRIEQQCVASTREHRGAGWAAHPVPPDRSRAAQILAAVRQLPSLSGAAGPRPVAGGRSHECWRLTSPAGDLLVKVPAHDPRPGRTARHAAMHRAAHAAGVPAARLIAASEQSAVLSAPVMVLAWVEGTDVEAAWPRLADTDRAAVCRGWGSAVARLHALRAPDFTGYPGTSWTQVATERAARLAARHAAAGLLPASQITAACRALEHESARLSTVVTPAFTHLDLHLPNVLTRQRRFAALLDFEHARWWDPAADLVKLEMWVFSRYPESRAPFWDGYTAAGGHLPAVGARLRVCQGLEWLSGLLYWNQIGDHAMYADYERRFSAWLAE